jgi:hypothetical protein
MDDLLKKSHQGDGGTFESPIRLLTASCLSVQTVLPRWSFAARNAISRSSDRTPEPTTILGCLTSEPMQKISILDARARRGPTATHPPKEERETEVEFYGGHVIVGGHVESADMPLINRLRFSLTCLEDWRKKTGISGKNDIPDRQPDQRGEMNNEFDTVEV